jgi:hypothetical protein
MAAIFCASVRFIVLSAEVGCCMWQVRRFKVRSLEDTSQQVDSGIAVWMECVTVNIMWKILHSSWTYTHVHVQLHNSTAHLLYKYCTNCTVCNWTVLTAITHKLPLHVQPHNSTAHLLYKLYSLQLNCTYSNYTQGAATCSAAQQHSTFTVQILYKLYSLQLNCTYSNYNVTITQCITFQCP